MTTHMNALTLRGNEARSMDIEAQQPEAPQYNRTLARAKIATLAAAGIAGALTTALVTLHEGSESGVVPGRSLLNEECSPNQLDYINKAKRALVISGATTGACFGGVVLGGCLMRGGMATADESEGTAATLIGCGSASIGWLMRQLGAAGLGLAGTATVISGIIYGVSNSKC